jgi:hypothetical protein
VKYVVATHSTRLNVRSWPDASARVISKLPRGTLVDVDPYTLIGTWRLLLGGGWVSGEFLKPVSATDSTPITPAPHAYAPLPNLETTWKTYPRDKPEHVKKTIGSAVNAAWIENTCTIRLSFAFNAAGHPIPKGPASPHVISGADGHWYAYEEFFAEAREVPPWS